MAMGVNEDQKRNSGSHQDSSGGYQWCGSRVCSNSVDGYEAYIPLGEKTCFHNTYELESVAALAVDLVKAISQVEEASMRLNFPKTIAGKTSVDVRLATQHIRKELLANGSSVSVKSSKILVSKVMHDITACIASHTCKSTTPAPDANDMQSRLAHIQTLVNDALAALEETTCRDESMWWLHSHKGSKPDGQDPGTPLKNVLFPAGVFDEARGTLVMPEPINHSKSFGTSMVLNEKSSRKVNHSWGQVNRSDTLLTRNLRGPDLTQAPRAENGSKFAESQDVVKLDGRHVTHDAPPLAISRANLEYLYLNQETVYHFMNLSNIISSHGWELKDSNINILQGAMVLVSHANRWHLRRIKSWSPGTMSIVLEDDTMVWPLNLYNSVLDENELHVDFALQEYTHQVHSSTIQRYQADEVLSTFYNLINCCQVLQQLLDSQQEREVILALVHNLQERPIEQHVGSFLKHLEVANLEEEQRLSQAYKRLVNYRDPRMQCLFSIWVQNYWILGQSQDHEKVNCGRAVEELCLHRVHSNISSKDGNSKVFEQESTGIGKSCCGEGKSEKCVQNTALCERQWDGYKGKRLEYPFLMSPRTTMLTMSHVESTDTSRGPETSGLAPARQLIQNICQGEESILDLRKTLASYGRVCMAHRSVGRGSWNLHVSSVESSNTVNGRTSLDDSHRQSGLTETATEGVPILNESRTKGPIFPGKPLKCINLEGIDGDVEDKRSGQGPLLSENRGESGEKESGRRKRFPVKRQTKIRRKKARK